VVWYGARLVLAGALTAGELTRFMLYTSMSVGRSAASPSSTVRSSARSAPAQRVREILREPIEPEGECRPVLACAARCVFADRALCYPSRPESKCCAA